MAKLVFGKDNPPGKRVGGSDAENEAARAALISSGRALRAAQSLTPAKCRGCGAPLGDSYAVVRGGNYCRAECAPKEPA